MLQPHVRQRWGKGIPAREPEVLCEGRANLNRLRSSSILNRYNERFKDNYLLSTFSPQGSGVQCQPRKAIPIAVEPSRASAPRAGISPTVAWPAAWP